MNWNKGYSASFYMTEVDAATWRDIGRIEITDGQIRREESGLLQSADVGCVDYDGDIERYVRIYMDTEQAGRSDHVALFTGLATSPDSEVDRRSRDSVQCYSVLKAADDVALLRGWYAPAGMRGAEIVKQLLSVTPAPVDIADGSPKLTTSIIAEDGETHLTMAAKVLQAINWRMKIAGNGRVSVEPVSDAAVAQFDAVDYDIIEPPLKITQDRFECPNVYLAIADDLTAIARDDSRTSPLSTVNRGREVWRQDTSADLADNESVEEYALRMLKEEQAVRREISYNRRFVPTVMPTDVVRLSYPAQKVEGLFRVGSQSITLGAGAKTAETVKEL